MPRRNRNTRTMPRQYDEPDDLEPTYQQLAADLVARGLADPAILGPVRHAHTREDSE